MTEPEQLSINTTMDIEYGSPADPKAHVRNPRKITRPAIDDTETCENHARIEKSRVQSAGQSSRCKPCPALSEILQKQEWRFAKTMPDHPHWYTLRITWTDEALFEKAVVDIRALGIDTIWKGRRYRKWFSDGWEYWTMGAPPEKTILINRAQTGGSSINGSDG